MLVVVVVWEMKNKLVANELQFFYEYAMLRHWGRFGSRILQRKGKKSNKTVISKGYNCWYLVAYVVTPLPVIREREGGI